MFLYRLSDRNLKNGMLKSVANVIQYAIRSFIGHTSPELLGKKQQLKTNI